MANRDIFILIGIIILLLGLRFVFSKLWTDKSGGVMTRVLIFMGCLIFVAWHFYKRQQYVGLVAVGLGAIAFGKYVYDNRNDGSQNRD